MNLDGYIEILQRIKEREGGELEVSRVVLGRKIIPTPRVSVLEFKTEKEASFKRWDPTYKSAKKFLMV